MVGPRKCQEAIGAKMAANDLIGSEARSDNLPEDA